MKHNIIHKIIFLILFSSVYNLYSQTLPYYHYTTKEGLPDANVHDIYQDKLGYIWFTTYKGISRFDGNTFTNYTTADGLRNNNIIGTAEGLDGTFYFPNYRKGLNAFKNGKFSDYDVYPENPFFINDIFGKNDTIYIIHKNYESISYIYKNNIHTYDTAFFRLHGIQAIYPYKHPDSANTVLLAGTDDGLFVINNKYNSITRYLKSGSFPVYSIKEDKDNNIWLGSKGKIYKVRDFNAELVLTLDEKINTDVWKMLVDSRGFVWFQPQEKGLFILKNNSLYDIGTKLSFGTTEVKLIYEDREGNVWVSTSGRGVYCFHNFFISHYFEDDGLFSNIINSILVNERGEKLIGTFDGLNILRNNKIEKIKTGNEAHTSATIMEIKAGLNNNYLVCGLYDSLGFIYSYDNNNFVLYDVMSSCQLDSATYVISAANSNLEILLSYNIFKRGHLIQTGEKFIFKDYASILTIYEIERTSDSVLWVGTSKGLCKLKGDEETYYENNDVLNSKINHIKVIPSGIVLIAGEKGISAILPDPDRIISLEKTEKYDFGGSTSIDIDNGNNVWIGNMKGLYRINLDSLINNNYNDILYFNEQTGLPSRDVHTVSYDKINNELWAGTEEGLAKIELNKMYENLHPPSKVIIENVTLKDTVLTNFNNLIFEPSQNNIRIHYTSLNFSSPKSISYEYKFEESQDWIETEYNDIDLVSLSPGKYNLLIRAVNINNIKGEITNLKFEILPPFWKTIWFYLLIALIILAIIFFVFLRRIKLIKNKANEQLKIQNSISELKHQALSASLNPHFIFNTLNSIQAYMNTHSKEEANEYLVNFSRLIRMNLDLAAKTFITLETELVRLELYLKYEKIRFEGMLNYEINISGDINPNTLMIPNMILQPFVENSIWHGILHKEDKGNILINISKGQKFLVKDNVTVINIDILDDGVGLNEIPSKKSSHISKGIALIKERLALLANEITNYEFIKIRNREDGISGVKVSIELFPNQYNFC